MATDLVPINDDYNLSLVPTEYGGHKARGWDKA